MKRQRAEREAAGISKLPEPILHHILSFLHQKEAVRTCVVSKSWRFLGSTRPKFSLDERYFDEDEEKLRNVLDKSFQVYFDRKLCIEELRVTMSELSPEMVLLLQKWIPIVAVKKLHLYFDFRRNYSPLPSVVFESESLQELFLRSCNLRQIQINSVVGNNLKTLHLKDVFIVEDETFAEFLSRCSLIEDLSLRCEGLRTINMLNLHNLKSFEIDNLFVDDDGSKIEIYLPSSVGRIIIDGCPNWFHHRNYFPGLTCLRLTNVPLSHEWFNSFPRNFPCLEELRLENCNGFDELKLSSPSIKNLDITMDESTTTKATIDAPNIISFVYDANISQSISFTATPSSEWNSEIHLSLDQLDPSQWFLKISELVAAFSQSQINSLSLYHYSGIEHPSVISICCGASSYKPVAIKSLSLNLRGVYYDFFFSDLVIGLFRFVRPREIQQIREEEFSCRTLQMGRWEEKEDEGRRSFFSWQQDLEEVSLQVNDPNNGTGSDEWHPVHGTINWSEFVAAIHHFYGLRFRLKWREFS